MTSRDGHRPTIATRRFCGVMFILIFVTTSMRAQELPPPPVKPQMDPSTLADIKDAPKLGPGISLLTPSTYNEAVADGHKSASATAAYEMNSVTMSNLVRDLKGSPRLRFPFHAAVITPYVRVVAAVAEARRKFQDPPTLNLSAVNAEGVQIGVVPTGPLSAAETIDNVVIRRDGKVVKPLKSIVMPTVFQNAFGAERQLQQAMFVFSFDTFAPTGDITIVFVGTSKNFEWPVSMLELSHWK